MTQYNKNIVQAVRLTREIYNMMVDAANDGDTDRLNNLVIVFNTIMAAADLPCVNPQEIYASLQDKDNPSSEERNKIR